MHFFGCYCVGMYISGKKIDDGACLNRNRYCCSSFEGVSFWLLAFPSPPRPYLLQGTHHSGTQRIKLICSFIDLFPALGKQYNWSGLRSVIYGRPASTTPGSVILRGANRMVIIQSRRIRRMMIANKLCGGSRNFHRWLVV